MKLRFVSLLPALAWFILIFILLTLPGSDIPKSEFLENIHFDKWVHTGLFAVLVFLFCYPFKDSVSYKNFLYLLITVLAVLYGIGMEYVQKYYTVGRSFDVFDMLFDGFGALVGYFFFRFIAAKSSAKNKPL